MFSRNIDRDDIDTYIRKKIKYCECIISLNELKEEEKKIQQTKENYNVLVQKFESEHPEYIEESKKLYINARYEVGIPDDIVGIMNLFGITSNDIEKYKVSQKEHFVPWEIQKEFRKCERRRKKFEESERRRKEYEE